MRTRGLGLAAPDDAPRPACSTGLLAGCGGGQDDAGKAKSDEVGKKSGRDEGPPVFAPKAGVGYQPRACGFDLDDDGIAGEPEDCRVCDGTTADPDGDGVAEDLIYVDAVAGKDQRGCGGAAERLRHPDLRLHPGGRRQRRRRRGHPLPARRVQGRHPEAGHRRPARQGDASPPAARSSAPSRSPRIRR